MTITHDQVVAALNVLEAELPVLIKNYGDDLKALLDVFSDEAKVIGDAAGVEDEAYVQRRSNEMREQLRSCSGQTKARRAHTSGQGTR
jgi:hypothetical protein